MKFFRKHQKLGNQGLSLVELLCSLAILGMLTMVVSGVLVVSANGYRQGNAETGAQQEAQLVANQITDLLIDASAHGVVSQVHFESGTLTITQGNIGYEVVQVGSELYFSRYDLDALGNRSNQTTPQLMAENLKENSFFVDTDQFYETGNVSIEMVYMKGTEEYPAAFNVTDRNKEKTPETVPVVELRVPTEIIQEPGQDFYRIKANVIGGSPVSYAYECEGNTDVNTVVDQYGTVKVGDRETANMFRIKVTATIDGGAAGIEERVKYVRVYVRRVTMVSLTGSLAGGVNCENGARYELTYSVDGNNMAKAVGTDYDDPDPAGLSNPDIAKNLYVDPKRVDWTVSSTGSTATHLGVDTTTGRAVLVLNGDMEDGEEITVTARAIHPRGANKSGKNYYPGAEAKWVLRKSASPFTLGDGWLRQTDTEQATIDGTMMGKLKQDNGVEHGGVHKIQVRFRAINPDGSYGSYQGWLGNEYNSDGDNSNSINLRPLMFGALDYSKDYEMEIRIGIFASNVIGTPEYVWSQRVWPTAGTPENEYYIKHVVNRVGLIFKGDHLGFGESLLISEASAPTINMKKDEGCDMMHCVGVQGIEPNRIKNEMRFRLEKKNAAGEWVEATGEEVQNANGTLKITFRSNNFAGNYRVKVWAEGMKNYVLDGYDYREDGTRNWKLWDEETGHNIFYFNVNQVY